MTLTAFVAMTPCLCCEQDNNVERAVDWIVSHADELAGPDEVPMEILQAGGQQAQGKFPDGSESKCGWNNFML